MVVDDEVDGNDGAKLNDEKSNDGITIGALDIKVSKGATELLAWFVLGFMRIRSLAVDVGSC
jgi:hypothetical protein